MKTITLARFLLSSFTLINLFCVSLNVKANDPSLQWKTLETPHFYIHFDAELKTTAQKTARLAEAIHKNLVKRLNWIPNRKTDLILTDATDFANGSATPFPHSRSTLIIKPSITISFDYYSWLESLITHEYTHILHLNKASGTPKALRNIIGRFPLLFPNVLEPTWFIEGIATYVETDHQRAIGRGQSSLFQMMMRMEVVNGIKPLSKVNVSNTDWPLNQVYLYGEHFYRFIEVKYGKKKTIEISDEYGNDLIPFFINRNTQKLFGKDLTQLWQEFTEYWNHYYNQQIKTIESNKVTKAEQLTQSKFLTQEFVATDIGLYYIRRNQFEDTMLMFLNLQGEHVEITPINSTATLDWHPSSGLLISQPEVCNNFNIFYDLYQLKEGSRELKRLTTCSRYSEAKWSKDGQSIIALKANNAIYSIDKLSKTGDFQTNIWRGVDDLVVSRFDISDDLQHILFSVKDPSSARFQLKEFNTQNKQWISLTNTHFNHVYPRYSHKKNKILFSADYDGVFNLYYLDRNDKTIRKLTNLIGGAFQVDEGFLKTPSENQTIYYTGYTADGFDLFKMELSGKVNLPRLASENPPNREEKKIVSEVNLVDNLKITDYSPWSSLKPAYWFPFSSGSEDQVEVGISTSGSDALGIHQYAAAIGANLDNQTPFGGLGYSYSRYLNLQLKRTIEFSQPVNDISSYLVEDEFKVGFHLPFTKIQSQWDLFAGLAKTEIEQGFYARKTFSPSSRLQDGIIGFGISFNNSQRFFKSNANTNGRQVSLLVESSDVLASDFSGQTVTLDWRELIQIKNEHSLALRFVKGWSTDNPNPFRLGGIDADPFILNGTQLNKRAFSLRGYTKGLSQLRGRRMQLANIEYRFPLRRVEKTLMAPPVGLGAFSGKIFYDYGSAFNQTSKSHYTSAGFEINTTLHLFYHLPLDFRFGFAKGFDLGGERKSYFTIGKSF